MLPKAHAPSTAIANHSKPLSPLLPIAVSSNRFLIERAARVGHHSASRFDVRQGGPDVRIEPFAGCLFMYTSSSSLTTFDPELGRAIAAERQRQEDHIELIASENYTSPRVLEAQGSVLTNKYAEGYPGKRYYGGCEYVDIAERLAIERVKELFGAGYANVQPHSGSQANQAVYFALLKPGDTIIGMSLAHGGHLTHGAAVNLSGKLFRAVSYGLNAAEEIDYDQVRALAEEFNPRMIVAGASAYALRIDWQKFRDIADELGAYLFVDMAHYAGLVAAGLYPNPVGIA